MKQYKTGWVTDSDTWLATIGSLSVYWDQDKDYFFAGTVNGNSNSNGWILTDGHFHAAHCSAPELTEVVAFVKAHYNLSQ